MAGQNKISRQQFVVWSDEKFIGVHCKRRRFWSSTSLSASLEELVWFFIGFVYPVLNPEAMEEQCACF